MEKKLVIMGTRGTFTELINGVLSRTFFLLHYIVQDLHIKP